MDVAVKHEKKDIKQYQMNMEQSKQLTGKKYVQQEKTQTTTPNSKPDNEQSLDVNSIYLLIEKKQAVRCFEKLINNYLTLQNYENAAYQTMLLSSLVGIQLYIQAGLRKSQARINQLFQQYVLITKSIFSKAAIIPIPVKSDPIELLEQLLELREAALQVAIETQECAGDKLGLNEILNQIITFKRDSNLLLSGQISKVTNGESIAQVDQWFTSIITDQNNQMLVPQWNYDASVLLF